MGTRVVFPAATHCSEHVPPHQIWMERLHFIETPSDPLSFSLRKASLQIDHQTKPAFAGYRGSSSRALGRRLSNSKRCLIK